MVTALGWVWVYRVHHHGVDTPVTVHDGFEMDGSCVRARHNTGCCSSLHYSRVIDMHVLHQYQPSANLNRPLHSLNRNASLITMYTKPPPHPNRPPFLLLSPDMLEFAGRVQEVVGVGLGRELAGVGLLHKVLVPLLLGEGDGVLLALEVDVRALHEVARRLPPDQRVLPPVALAQHVPVHAPACADLRAGLGGRLGRFVDAVWRGVTCVS